jgi:hypothetical protein
MELIVAMSAISSSVAPPSSSQTATIAAWHSL